MNHLSGEQALNLARIRFGYTTIIRNENQTAIIKGIFNKITSLDVIVKVPKLVQLLGDTVETDLSPKQISNMICLIRKMNNEDLRFAGIPTSD